MKRCPKCGVEKPKAEFLPKTGAGRLRAYCHPCWREYARERKRADPEADWERQRQWRQRNWDAEKRRQYRWRKRHPEKWKALVKRWAVKHRAEFTKKQREADRTAVYAHYGECCACCGEAERLFLTIDHVNNDGAKHRRELATKFGKGGSMFFRWLIKNEFPSGFQTLCRNCNWGKHANGGICPHQATEGSTTKGGSPVAPSGAKRAGSRKRS